MLTNPKPLKTYTAPALPTLNEVKNDHDFLKKMPLRWKKCAAVCTAVGLMGSWVLTGCTSSDIPVDEVNTDITTPDITIAKTTKSPKKTSEPLLVTETSEPPSATTAVPMPTTTTVATTVRELRSETDEDYGLAFRLHHGGSGGTPNYVVHLTEQEALGIIKSNLQKAGLRFDSDLSELSGEYGYYENERMAISNFYDSKKRVAIVHLGWSRYSNRFGDNQASEADFMKKDLEQRAKERDEDVTFGVFYSDGTWDGLNALWYEDENGNWVQGDEPTDHEMEKAKANAYVNLKKDLNKQVDDFVKFLKKEGIL